MNERVRREWAESPAPPEDLHRSSPPCADCGGPLASALLPLQTLGPPLNCHGPWQNPSGDEGRWEKVRATVVLTRTPPLVCLPGSYLCAPEGQERDEGGRGLGVCEQRAEGTEVVAPELRDQGGWGSVPTSVRYRCGTQQCSEVLSDTRSCEGAAFSVMGS